MGGAALSLFALFLCAVPAPAHTKHYFKCPSRDLMMSSDKAKVEMWNFARIQIGLPPLRANASLLSFIDQFLDKDHGVEVFGINDTAVSYARIYKCANDNIGQNLLAARTMDFPNIGLSKQSKAFNLNTFHKFAKSFNPPREVDSFTFVRDPLAHFRSGFREYLDRCPQEMPPSSYLPDGLAIIDTDFLKSQIERILQGLKPEVFCGFVGFDHVYAMAGVLKPYWNITFVGHLERFDKDWEVVEKNYGVDIPDDPHLGLHKSSQDRNGVEPAFKLLEMSDPGYIRALCVILYYDYVCFGYDLPSVCRPVHIVPADALQQPQTLFVQPRIVHRSISSRSPIVLLAGAALVICAVMFFGRRRVSPSGQPKGQAGATSRQNRSQVLPTVVTRGMNGAYDEDDD